MKVWEVAVLIFSCTPVLAILVMVALALYDDRKSK